VDKGAASRGVQASSAAGTDASSGGGSPDNTGRGGARAGLKTGHGVGDGGDRVVSVADSLRKTKALIEGGIGFRCGGNFIYLLFCSILF
jgi:hypothetical protein